MEQDRIWWLIGRKIGGEATLDELRELDERLREDAALRYKVSLMEPADQNPKHHNPATLAAFESHLLRMKELFPEDFDNQPAPAPETPAPAKHKRPKLLIATLTIAFLLGAYGAFNWLKDPPVRAEHELSTLNGSKTKALLPDGTTVWLNGGSRIIYPTSWKGQKARVVTLIGEAFFDVAHEASQPFIIQTGSIEVRVLGTSFNIKAYPNDKTVETSLVSGAVEIRVKGENGQRILLLPNQKLIIPNNKYLSKTNNDSTGSTASRKTKPTYVVEPLTANPVDSVVAETAWRDNFLVFENENFGDIADKMERWYGVKLHFDNEKLLQYRFTGKFEKETVTEILDALQFTTPFRYRVENQDIFINQ